MNTNASRGRGPPRSAAFRPLQRAKFGCAGFVPAPSATRTVKRRDQRVGGTASAARPAPGARPSGRFNVRREGALKIPGRAEVREVKRRERRAPGRLAGTVSQGSPEGFRGYRWADGFESRWDSRIRERIKTLWNVPLPSQLSLR